MIATLLLCVLAAEPASITAARKHLAENKLDEVLFDLQGQHLEGADAQQAADVLGQAATKSFEAKDDLMALQFAQMALSQSKWHPTALEMCARASFRQQQFAEAERCGDLWLEGTKSPAAVMFRAELAASQGDWDKVLVTLNGKNLPEAQAGRAKLLRATATKELQERGAALAQAKAIEDTAARAGAIAEAQLKAESEAQKNAVIVYSASWCGYCTRLRAWLRQRRIAFTEHDIEKEPAAKAELQAKLVRAGNPNASGVPITDVRGTMVYGFDVAKLEAALRR